MMSIYKLKSCNTKLCVAVITSAAQYCRQSTVDGWNSSRMSYIAVVLFSIVLYVYLSLK